MASDIIFPEKGFFEKNQDILRPLLDAQSKVQHQVRHDTSLNPEEIKIMLRDARKNLSKGIILAKSMWCSKIAESIHDMDYNPKDAWKGVKAIEKFITGTHKSCQPTFFQVI